MRPGDLRLNFSREHATQWSTASTHGSTASTRGRTALTFKKKERSKAHASQTWFFPERSCGRIGLVDSVDFEVDSVDPQNVGARTASRRGTWRSRQRRPVGRRRRRVGGQRRSEGVGASTAWTRGRSAGHQCRPGEARRARCISQHERCIACSFASSCRRGSKSTLNTPGTSQG